MNLTSRVSMPLLHRGQFTMQCMRVAPELLVLACACVLGYVLTLGPAAPVVGSRSLLSSHWGSWLGVSIVVPALAAFAFLLLVRLPVVREVVPAVIPVIAAGCVAVSCMWFAMVAAVILRSIEPWVVAVVVLGLVASVMYLSQRVTTRKTGAAAAAGISAALLGVIVPQLAATHWSDPVLNFYDTGTGRERLVLPLGGDKPLAPHEMPMLGSPDAPAILLSFFDYSDARSRVTQRALAEVRRRYGGQVAVMPVVYPIHPICNPRVEGEAAAERADACGFARLSLAVWRVDPAKFEEFHMYLCNPDEPAAARTIVQAIDKAAELLGQEGLNQGMSDAWVIERMYANIHAKPHMPGTLEDGELEDHLPVVMWRRPDLSVPGHTVLGMIGQGEAVYDWLERELDVTPGVAAGERGDQPDDGSAANDTQRHILELLQ